MASFTLACWSLLACLACQAESKSMEHCNADSPDECQDSTAWLQTRTYVNEDQHTHLHGGEQEEVGTGITRVLSSSLQIPVENLINDAKDYRAPKKTKPGVYLDSGIPMPVGHMAPFSGMPWPLYGYETDSKGASCRPAKIPSDCKDGVVKTLNLNPKSKVTIPCGECWRLSGAGTLDLPDGLVVHGHLEIADPGAGQEVIINTRHVLVLGHLQIRPDTSNSMTSLKGKVTFHVMKNLPKPVIGKTELHYVREGCGSNCAIGLGHSAFAVVGGSVDLRGFPSSGSSWYRLAANADENAVSIQIDGDVSGWPVGGEIIITSTEFVSAIHGYRKQFVSKQPSYAQDERRSISSVSYDSQRKVSTIQLDKKLDHTHWGTIMDIAGYGKAPQIRAEVALLSRQIVIEGPTDAELADLQKNDNATLRSHGAHFGVFWTSTPQHIEGVEFRRMGQQGSFGRYPLHVHMCQDHPTTKILRNSVVDSKQRCYVIHGTGNVTLEENVAHNNVGHCFMLEDGYETGTKLFRNLVSNLKPPKDQPGVDPFQPGFGIHFEDDYTPSGYWIANIDAWLDGNVATGVCTCAGCDPLMHKCEMCDESVWGSGPSTSATIRTCAGVWFKMSRMVRRESKFLPGAGSMIRDTLIKGSDVNHPRVKDNVMHSNHMGFRYYRPGWCPETIVHEEGQTFYKNYKAVFNHKNQNFEFKNYLFVDNREHLNSDQIDNMVTKDSAFVGVSPMSQRSGSMCQTAGLYAPRALQWDGHFYFQRATGLGNSLRNVTFSNFDKQCTDEHGQVVQPITIMLNVESSNCQDWTIEELDDLAVDNTKRLLHFDPYEYGKGQSEIPGQSDYATLVKGLPGMPGGKLPKQTYMRSWFLRARHFYVKNSPTIDSNTAQGGTRWWLPQNHWQGPVLGMSFPEYMGCYINKKKWLNMAHNTQAWAANDAPIYMDEQIYKCNQECRKTSAVYFSLRRADNANVKSTNCRCMEQNGQAMALNSKYNRDNQWSCGTTKWWMQIGSKTGNANQDARNAIYKIAHSSGKEQCEDFLPSAENMMSCPANLCARIIRFAWHFDDGTTWTTPSAIHIEDQTASPAHSLYQPGGPWGTAMIMMGDGGGNTGSNNAPESVGTGSMSILGGRKYKVQVSKPVGKSSDKWQPTAFRSLKLELFDARESVPAVLDRPECAVDLEIDLQKVWANSMIPAPRCGKMTNSNCQLSPQGQSCTVNQAGTGLICNSFKSGHIDIQMDPTNVTYAKGYSDAMKQKKQEKNEKKKKKNSKMPR